MYKLHLFLPCLIVFGLSLLHLAKCSENQTCEIAKSFTKSNPNDKVRVHCDTDKSCAGFHCRGIYLIDNAQLHIKKGDPVCFGAIINHCDDPLSMDVYFQSVFMNSSFQNRLHHNASIQIPGVTLRADMVKANLFIFVELTHKDNKVTIALRAKVRFTLGKRVDWPEALNFQVIPEQTFPVPPCLPGESRNVTPIPVFQSCIPPTDVPLPATVKPKSATYGKPCDPSKVYQCGEKEMCTYNKTCDCLGGMVLNPFSGLCDIPGASPKPKLNPAAATIKSTSVASNKADNNPKKSIMTTIKSTSVASSKNVEHPASHKADNNPKKSTSGLITGLAVGAVAVLGIVILISFLIWRSRASSQFDHVPFVDNDEEVI